MSFSRQEYWNGWPFPPPEIFSTQRLNTWQADSLPLSHWVSQNNVIWFLSTMNFMEMMMMMTMMDGDLTFYLIFFFFFRHYSQPGHFCGLYLVCFVLFGWLADLFSKWLWWLIVLIFQKFPENVPVTIYAGELTTYGFLLESIQMFPKNSFRFGCKYYQLVFGVYVLEPWGAHMLNQHYCGCFCESVFRWS